MGKGGYGLTYQEVYEMENLTIEAKAIYGMLCSYAGSKATAYPSVDFICNKLKISRTRFYRHMNLLVGAGVVKKEQRKNENQSFSGNVYVLVPNLQNMKKPCAENIQMPYTENEHAGNASTGNEATNNNTINNNTINNKNIEYEKVIEMFNTICVSYPKVKSLSEARKNAIRARLRTYSIDDLRKAFEAMERSEFLRGKNSSDWSANFDWVMKDRNLAKVLDGNYKNKEDKNYEPDTENRRPASDYYKQFLRDGTGN